MRISNLTLVGALALATAAACGGGGGRTVAAPDFRAPHSSAVVATDLPASSAQARIEPVELIHFDTDSVALDGTARADLDAIAEWMAAHPDQFLIVEGHADRRGPALYNAELAYQRATAAADRLLARGVGRSRIVIEVYGETKPADPARHAPNRRVRLYAAPPDRVASHP